MTQQEVHEIIMKSSDVDKMNLAMSCQMNGVHPVQLENTIANVLTGIQKNFALAMKYYEYFGGK